MIKMAVLGFGTVGSGVVELIDINQEVIRRAVPEGIYVKHILDLREFPDSPYNDRVTHDFEDILNDPEIRIICETMGGKEPAYTFTKKALERGISVCTSNKELVAAFGPELLKTAADNHCSYLFEASVGGGIPIIRPLNECLKQEEITSIYGILNGTTNYIMTRMEEAGLSFEEALKEAQDSGYAERNPEADVEGHDACRKIAILSSLACGKTVRYEDIPCEGISGITKEDFGYARKMGMAIKLLGVMKREKSGLCVRTAPFMLKADHPLYSVRDVFNAVFVHGNMVDDLMFYGRGAGKFPTASAVVSDIMQLAATLGTNLPCVWSGETVSLSDSGQERYRYFVRADKGLQEAAKKNFGQIEYVHSDMSAEDEIAFITPRLTEDEWAKSSTAFGDVISKIRLLSD